MGERRRKALTTTTTRRGRAVKVESTPFHVIHAWQYMYGKDIFHVGYSIVNIP